MRNPSVLLLMLLMPLVCAFGAPTAVKKNFTVTLDAGHGGHDPGAIGKLTQEKKITLAVTLKLGKRIESENPDVKVVYTRKSDAYITLQGRADIANAAKSDLFLCIHVNANNNKAVDGCETYTLGLHKTQSNLDVAMRENSVIQLEDNYATKYSGFDPKSVDSYIMFEFMQDRYVEKSVWLAGEVEKQFASAGRRDRGVRQAGFWVLHKTAMPAVLIEIGYITNAEEEQFLNSEEGQQKMADAIYEAFLKFRKQYDEMSGRQTIENLANLEKRKEAEYEKANQGVPVAQRVASSAEKAQRQMSVQEKDAAASRAAKAAVAAQEAQKKEAERSKEQAEREKREAQEKAAEEEHRRKEQERVAMQKKQAEVNVMKKQIVASSKNLSKEEQEAIQQPYGGGAEYRLQLMALRAKLGSQDKAFKGLKVDVEQENGLYKYTYGKTYDFTEIVRLKQQIKDKFPNAMIVAIKDGKRITVKEAMRENQKTE